jgi:hypothetical protein
MTIADWVALLVAVPGVIAGVAAIPEGSNRPLLVTACGVFLVAALALGAFAAVRPSAAASTAQAPGATAPSSVRATSTAHATASPARPKPDLVRWHGQVTITSNGLDLDPVPPTQASGSDWDITIGALNQDQVGDADAGSIPTNTAPWNGSSFPTRQQCTDQIDTNPAHLITVRPGDIVCVQTQAGRIAALQFTS